MNESCLTYEWGWNPRILISLPGHVGQPLGEKKGKKEKKEKKETKEKKEKSTCSPNNQSSQKLALQLFYTAHVAESYINVASV